MNATKLNTCLPQVMEAARHFLTDLLGREAPLNTEGPTRTSFENAKGRFGTDAVVLMAVGHVPLAIVLEAGWVPVLSQAMLGEQLDVSEAVAMNFLREFAEQGYAAISPAANALQNEVPFEILAPYDPDFHERLGDTLVSVPFTLGGQLNGLALLPADAYAAEPAPSAKNAIPDMTGAITQKSTVATPDLPDVGSERFDRNNNAPGHIGVLADVELEVTVELGRRKVLLAEVLRMTKGSVIELEKFVGEPLFVYANGRLIAEGEAVVVDEQFGVRITRLVSAMRQAA